MKTDKGLQELNKTPVPVTSGCKCSYAGYAPYAILALYSLLSPLNTNRFSGSHRDLDCYAWDRMFGRKQHEKWGGGP